MRFLIGFFLVLSCYTLMSQSVSINEEPGVKKMMDHFINLNKSKPYLQGYRIQLAATTSRDQLEQVKLNFEELYPNVPTKWEHTNPYFKFQIGAYATKLEALQAIYKLKEVYPGAYLVIDKNIPPKEILQSKDL